MSRFVTQNGAVVTCTDPNCTCNPTPAPTDLDAIFDQIADLIIEWHEADRWADNCPRSERDDARGLADERKDTVMEFLKLVVAK